MMLVCFNSKWLWRFWLWSYGGKLGPTIHPAPSKWGLAWLNASNNVFMGLAEYLRPKRVCAVRTFPADLGSRVGGCGSKNLCIRGIAVRVSHEKHGEPPKCLCVHDVSEVCRSLKAHIDALDKGAFRRRRNVRVRAIRVPIAYEIGRDICRALWHGVRGRHKIVVGQIIVGLKLQSKQHCFVCWLWLGRTR